ncbi:MAG: SLBB domain-containing protein [Bacteroidetes bacterium]|nr:SLBB domain-containing protein [Bacteroidota bacterium]
MGCFQNKKLITLVFLTLLLFANYQIHAQVFDNPTSGQSGLSGFSNATAFVFGSSEGVNIEVSLWGYVTKPGLYKIPHTTDLISLISLAGGPRENARLDDVRIIRLISNSENNKIEERIITVNIEEFIEKGDRTLIPVLKPGDVVVMTGSAYTVFVNFMSVVRDVALVLNTVLLVYTISKK